MSIPSQYQPRVLDEKDKEGYLNWSLDFFTDVNVIQSPYLHITIQLDVTNAYKFYQKTSVEGATFFSFLTWHFVQTLKNHFCFNLRLVENQWFILDNPPIIIPVAVGGADRFSPLTLENVSQISYKQFISQYRQKLDRIRQGERPEYEIYDLCCVFGNLPNLQFTGFTLHWQTGKIIGQTIFYFGKRYWQNDRLFIPFVARLHHACTDPFVLDLLLQDVQKRWSSMQTAE